MKAEESHFVSVSELRIGLFVELDVSWMAHPFPTGSFKISSASQIETIRGMGLQRVRFDPAKSDPIVERSVESTAQGAQPHPAKLTPASPEQARKEEWAQQLEAQQRSLVVCERRFGDAIVQYRKTLDLIRAQPTVAAQQCAALVGGFVGEMLTEGESAIRLLSETAGDKAALHPVNVTIVSLLLGKAIGLAQEDLVDLGVAAFLHDVGKSALPERVRWHDDGFSSTEVKVYQEHVAQSLQLGRTMGLSRGALKAIAQHHELADGSGFPERIKADAMSGPARVLALVNRYDNLCNPGRPGAAMTPHEALSMIFAQQRARFDPVALSAFIRMMGVYPPGSVVQLLDERYAMVVSVNAARPLKPRIVVHDPGVPRYDALIVDLEREPNLAIRRSVKPALLPHDAMDYLSPRQRISYFFESVPNSRHAGAMA
ncbi:MAG: DUF3391 domain-containing protein [Burkholderiales bacterium]